MGRGHSKSLKMAPIDNIIYDFLLVHVVRFSSYLTLNNRDLEIWVKGHSRSFKLVPFESLGAVSYSPSILTIAVSLTVYEISTSKNSVTLKTGLGVVQGH